MATTFNDLVRAAQPALCSAPAAATEGLSWEWAFELVGADGSAPDLTGVSAVCRVLSKIDGTVVLTLTTSITANVVTVTATPASTVGLAGTGSSPRQCVWHLTLTNGAGRKLDVFGVQTSPFNIHQGAA